MNKLAKKEINVRANHLKNKQKNNWTSGNKWN